MEREREAVFITYSCRLGTCAILAYELFTNSVYECVS